MIQASGTRWVRLWAHLTSLWPTQGAINQQLLNELDYQISLARAYGCGVILTVHHDLPSWINGSTVPTRAPADTGPSSPWAVMFTAFASRYSVNNANRPVPSATVDMLEFCNEPNQLWNTNGLTVDLPFAVANLFTRAKSIVAQFNGSPLVAGPATGDLGPEILGLDNYVDFTIRVLNVLKGNGFFNAGPNFSAVWTQHNYSDVSYDHGPDTTAPDRNTYRTTDPNTRRQTLRSLTTRNILNQNGWRGWPSGNAGDARLFITEGGADRPSVARVWNPSVGLNGDQTGYENYQNYLGARNLQRLATDTQGAGCEMVL